MYNSKVGFMIHANKTKKRVIAIGVLAVILVIGAEIFLRAGYGFCDAVLMQEDPDFEYIVQPNQDRYRFGNHVRINSLSMRSDEVDTAAVHILGFGDSVLNGGTQTDDDSLASAILTRRLSEIRREKVQFLNISAGSWGADNCFAYLKKYGNFNAKSIFLFVSSHDAYDNMTFQKTVDVHESFPSKQYPFAVVELLDRYVFPQITRYFPKPGINYELQITNYEQPSFFRKFVIRNSQFVIDSPSLGINKKNAESRFNTGFSDFYAYSVSNQIPLTIYLHADRKELAQQSYNEQGKEIIAFANEHNIPIIKDLENGLENSDFRDNIHLNVKGQRKMAESIINYELRICGRKEVVRNS